MIPKQFIGFSELVEYTGLSRSTIYRLINEGRLTPKKPTGGRVFFAKIEVDKLFSIITSKQSRL